MIYNSVSIDINLLNSMKPYIVLPLRGHPKGQMLLKWCLFMLYGPNRYKKVIELKFQCYIINSKALLI